MFEEKYKISAVEGNSFSGKTTLLRTLKEKYQVEVAWESMKYAQDKHKFPHFPPQSIEDAKKAVQIFVDLEKIRINDVIDKCIRSGKPVIMDRSPLSAIVFEYAIKKLQPDIINVYAYTLEAFQEQVKTKELSLPSVIVYLEPESRKAFLERVKARGQVQVDFLNQPESVELMQNWYKLVLSDYYADNSSILLKSRQGDTEIMAQIVAEFLIKANYTNDTDGILANLLTNENV